MSSHETSSFVARVHASHAALCSAMEEHCAAVSAAEPEAKQRELQKCVAVAASVYQALLSEMCGAVAQGASC